MTDEAASASLNETLRGLPQVESVLSSSDLAETLQRYRRDVVKRIVAAEIAAHRSAIMRGNGNAAPGADDLAASAAAQLRELSKPCIRPVINASGVILHTNLGRAVLSPRACDWVNSIAAGYSDLELDLASGERTRRDYALEPLLIALTGCEAATVVNNNAAAVFLVLHTLSRGREVITSRGELVEIGGSYRVPSVVENSGALLREVGTTNRTRLADYEAALGEWTGLLLKTHPSNYSIEGFTEDTAIEDLVALGRRSGVPVYYDLGSGYIPPESAVHLDEPDVFSALASGVDLLSFSGDKLLGGSQAGIILGRKEYIERLRRSPLWRVLRIDKLTLAALGAALVDQLAQPGSVHNGSHIAGRVRSEAELQNAAEELCAALQNACPEWSFNVVDCEGSYGGGSAPAQRVPSRAVSISTPRFSADQLERLLRQGEPPIIGSLLQGQYLLNLLTLLPGESDALIRRMAELQ